MNHADRIGLLLQSMDAENIDAIVAFSNAAHHVDYGDAVALLSGFKPLGPSFTVLHKTGKSMLCVSPAWDGERARTGARTDDVEATDDLLKAFAGQFSNSSSFGRVGTADLGKMPHGFAADVKRALGDHCSKADTILFAAAARKTDEEIDNARTATKIAEQTYQYLLEVAQPGMPECHLAADLKSHSRLLGADDNFMMFHAGNHPLAVQPSNGRKLEVGDLILAEITPSYRGQFAQICRTACLGEATDQQHEKYEIVVRAMKNGIEAARPGVPMKDICEGVDEVLRAEGYGEYCEPPYMNRRGHGLGITSMEPGNVGLKNEIILEDGMFFVVHPNQYIPEVGYLLCGEPILIRDPEAEVLTAEFASLGTIPV